MTHEQDISAIGEAAKTALYYEYISVDVHGDHVIESTLTDLLNDPSVEDENIKKVTYYLVQKFFLKTVNEKKEIIDLVSQIPGAFKKMADAIPAQNRNKQTLVKYFELYFNHTVGVQKDQVKLFESYNKVLKGFIQKLKETTPTATEENLQDKEQIIDQIYHYIDSINTTTAVSKKHSKEKARAKIDDWIAKIYENHIIKGALDVALALENYCLEEMDLSKNRIAFLDKYAKTNLKRVSQEILEDLEVDSIEEAWPVITENIFIYIDHLTKEHGDYRKFLAEVLTPFHENFTNEFFKHFFLIGTLQHQIEKDIYLLEKTYGDLQLIQPFRGFFVSALIEQIKEGKEKAYCIENTFQKIVYDTKGPHKNTCVYLTFKYLLEEIQEVLKDRESMAPGTLPFYKRGFYEFTRPKYPKLTDQVIYTYLTMSKALERKIGNTRTAYRNIYKKNTALLQNVFLNLGLKNDFNRVILPIITGLEETGHILKNK